MSLRERVNPGVSRRKDFPLESRKAALLIIDVQKYLVPMTTTALPLEKETEQERKERLYYTGQASAMIKNIQNLAAAFRVIRDDPEAAEQHPQQSTGGEVIFVYLQALTNDARDISLDYKLSGPSLCNIPVMTTPLDDIFLKKLQPDPVKGKGDILMPKTSCSVFQSTNLDYVLRNLNVEQLVIAGQLTDQCIESAVRDAADLGYLVTLVEDACAAETLVAHLKGLHGVKGFCRILQTAQVLDELLEDLMNEQRATSSSGEDMMTEAQVLAYLKSKGMSKSADQLERIFNKKRAAEIIGKNIQHKVAQREGKIAARKDPTAKRNKSKSRKHKENGGGGGSHVVHNSDDEQSVAESSASSSSKNKARKHKEAGQDAAKDSDSVSVENDTEENVQSWVRINKQDGKVANQKDDHCVVAKDKEGEHGDQDAEVKEDSGKANHAEDEAVSDETSQPGEEPAATAPASPASPPKTTARTTLEQLQLICSPVKKTTKLTTTEQISVMWSPPPPPRPNPLGQHAMARVKDNNKTNRVTATISMGSMAAASALYTSSEDEEEGSMSTELDPVMLVDSTHSRCSSRSSHSHSSHNSYGPYCRSEGDPDSSCSFAADSEENEEETTHELPSSHDTDIVSAQDETTDAAGNSILKAAFIMSGRRKTRSASLSPARETVLEVMLSGDTTCDGDVSLDAAEIAESVADIAADSVKDAAVDDAVSDELPPEWTEVMDPASSCIYYCNSETGETTWERPVKTTVSQEKTKSTSATTPISSDRQTGTDSADDMPEEGVASASQETAGETPKLVELPPGWIQTTDPATNNIYYYNSTTNETSWEVPENDGNDEKPLAPVSTPAIDETESDAGIDAQKEITADSSSYEALTATTAMSSSTDSYNEPSDSLNASTDTTVEIVTDPVATLTVDAPPTTATGSQNTDNVDIHKKDLLPISSDEGEDLDRYDDLLGDGGQNSSERLVAIAVDESDDAVVFE